MSVISRDAIPKTIKKNHFPKFSWSWVSIPSLLLAWMLIATQFPSYILPQVWDVAQEGYLWVVNGELMPHLWASFLEEVGGFGTAIIVALVCGFMAGVYRATKRLIHGHTSHSLGAVDADYIRYRLHDDYCGDIYIRGESDDLDHNGRRINHTRK